MTTHYQKIQALGNKMASNLETMGVSASFSDGGLTLADKILQIQHFTEGLLLSADKSVDQSGNTVKLTALYMSNGETVSGKEVSFFPLVESSATSRTITANTVTPVGSKYSITSLPGHDKRVYLDRSNSVYIHIDLVDGNTLHVGSWKSNDWCSNFSVENGVVTYKIDGSTYTKDCSSYDMSVIKCNSSGCVVSDYGVFDTTDDYGVASTTYTCSGAGEKTITAMSGSVVSEPYEVIDAVFYDTGISGTANTHYVHSRQNVTRTPTPNYTEIIDNNSDSFTIVAVSPNNGQTMSSCCVLNQNVCIEVDIVESNLVGYRLYDYTSSGLFDKSINNFQEETTVKFEVKDNKVYLYYDGVLQANPPSFNPTNPFLFGFNVRNTSTLKFKNLKVYPI